MLENYRRCRFCILCVSEGCGLDLGFWVGCGDCGFDLDHLCTLVFTETTSEQCPRRREESRREHPQKQTCLFFSFPSSNTHRVLTTHTRHHGSLT